MNLRDELRRIIEERSLSMTLDEAAKLAEYVDRLPTPLEFHLFDTMWSEHCSYKSSRPVLRNLPVSGDNVAAPGYPKWTETADGGRVHINGEQYFAGVDASVWEFRIGGYRVLSRWLKQRRSRRLEEEDIRSVTRMIAVLKETIQLMLQIDAAIPRWPIR
jgi:hypothetical protein